MITKTIKIALAFLLLLSAGCAVSVDTTTLDFGSNKTTETLTLTIKVPVKWSVDCSETWVTVTPNSGQGQGTNGINVAVDRAGLSPGDYEATLTISTNTGLPCPEVVVKMSVPNIPPVPSEVTGYVYKEGTSTPISEALVSIGTNAYYSESSGYYYISGDIATGLHIIEVTKEGYHDYRSAINVSDNYTEHIIYMIPEDETPPPPTTTTTQPSTTTSLPIDPDNPGYNILGCGTDVFGEYAVENNVKGRALDIDALNADGILALNPVVEERNWQSASGHTIQTYASKLAASVGISGSYMFFSASIKSSFTDETYKNTNFSYATIMEKIYKDSLRVQNDKWNAEHLRRYLTDAAYKAINDTDEYMDWTGENIISAYGTHVMVGIFIGARLDYNLAISIEDTKNKRHVEAYASARFKGFGAKVTMDIGMETDETSTFNNYERRETIYAKGGDSQYANPSTAADINRWRETLDDKPAFCGIMQNALIPIWEFAETANRRNEIASAYHTYAQLSGLWAPESPRKIAHYLFDAPGSADNPNVIKDYSGGNNHASMLVPSLDEPRGPTPTCDRDRPGEANSAFLFDGEDDYIILPSGLTPPELTLSMWIRPYYRPDNGRASGVLFQNNHTRMPSDPLEGGVNLIWDDSTWYDVCDDTRGNIILKYMMSNPESVEPHMCANVENDWQQVLDEIDPCGTPGADPLMYDWHHVVITYNGALSQMVIYTDFGSPEFTYHMVDLYDQLPYGPSPISWQGLFSTIGGLPPDETGNFSNANHFWGAIDDVRLYNFPLTPEQIITLYDCEADGVIYDDDGDGTLEDGEGMRGCLGDELF